MNKRVLSFVLILLITLTLQPYKAAAEESSWQFGTVEYYSTFTKGSTLTDSYCYTDDWFLDDSTVANNALALASMQLTAAAAGDDTDELGIVFLKELGFDETGYVSSDPSEQDSCNYTWGKKTITSAGETFSLAAVVIQSYSFDQEVKKTGWTQNFRVNGGTLTEEHYGFSCAVEKVIGDIAEMCGSGNTKVWITGQSRGGALAGMIAAELPAVSDITGKDIYAYTFESPAVVEKSAVPNHETDYGYIHNYISNDDIVTMLPPWDMVRYGKEYELNTEEINKKLPKELKRIGTEEYKLTQAEPETPYEPIVESIRDSLTDRISERKDYSAENTDKITDDNGSEITLTYVYQDVLTGLMDLIFGDSFENIDKDIISEKMNDLYPAACSLLEAVQKDSNKDYYDAAKGLMGFAETCGIELPLSETDLYALLKLVGPAMINPDYVPEEKVTDMTGMIGYFQPVLELYADIQYIIFSHQFETVIARLKVLSPMPEMESLDIRIEEPAAGDRESEAVEETEAFIDSLGNSWMSVTAKWKETEDTLADDQVHYLEVALTTVAHNIPKDFPFTINGTEPVNKPKITYKEGKSTVRATWAFTLGKPEKITVSFDAGGHMENPEAVIVDAGSELKYVLTPPDPKRVSDGEETWQFNSWYDEKGQKWDAVTAKENLTLTADWSKLIDTVEITYEIPYAGGKTGQPFVADDADYYLSQADILDSSYNEVTAVNNTDPMILELQVSAKNDKYLFALEKNEWEDFDYVGTFTVNGEDVEANYDQDGGYLRAEYRFTPLAEPEKSTEGADREMPEKPKKTAPVQTGDGGAQGIWQILLTASVLVILTALHADRRKTR